MKTSHHHELSPRLDQFQHHSHRLDPFQRQAIYRLVNEGKSALEIFDLFFGFDTSKVSLKLKSLKLFFSRACQEDLDIFKGEI
jgi:hypothetical protein